MGAVRSNIILILLSFVLFACSSRHSQSTLSGCAAEKSIQIYASTVHPFVTSHCSSCHGDTGFQSPQFALSDAALSWEKAVSLIENIVNGESRIVTRSKDFHCGIPENCGTDGSEASALTLEYERLSGSAEQSCLLASAGNYSIRTARLPIPPNLPLLTSYVQIQWDLSMQGSIDPPDPIFNGMTLIIDIQESQVGAAYRVRNPRLIIPPLGKNAEIRNLQVEINGDPDIASNPYKAVKIVAGIGMTTALSTLTQYLLRQTPQDEISISFEVFKEATPCRFLASSSGSPNFTNDVRPTFSSCSGCHTNTTTQAFNAFNMGSGALVNNATLCMRSMMRADSSNPSQSILMNYPFFGINGHPKITAMTQSQADGFVNWITREFGP